MDNVFVPLLRALRFAATKHRDQKRKGQEASPYINHPIAVATLLAESGVTDTDILQAAILHDTIEDTQTTEAELVENFGRAVASLVLEVTDDKNLEKDVRKQHQIDHAPKLSAGARLIKIADKTCNIRDVVAAPPTDWPLERRVGYLDWARQVVTACQGGNAQLDAAFNEALNAGTTQLGAL